MTRLDIDFVMAWLFSAAMLCMMLFLGQLYVGSARSGCSIPLGMRSGTVKDSQISAKTWDSGWEPERGRLYNDRAWCSKDKKKEEEYFQVDLKKVRHVSAIGIQGTKTHFSVLKYYVETYKVKYSFDGATWYWYKVWDSSALDYTVKTFTGNSDSVDRVIRSTYRESFVSKFIRLYPLDYKRDMCIRAEIYGCANEKDTCSSFLTTLTGNITSPNYPGKYSSESDCTWIISVMEDKNVTLLVRDFDVGEPLNPGQCEDVLQIYDGPLDRSTLLGSYCNGLSLPTVIKSSGNTIRLHFQSKPNRSPHKGFWIQYLTTSGADDVHTATACEGGSVYLTCEWYSYSINILHVFFGSLPYSPTCHGMNVATSTCSSSSAVSYITAHCQHFKSCNITVDKARFGQPCRQGVIPQLQIYYQCTSTTIKTTAPPLPSAAPTPLPTKPDSLTQAPSGVVPSSILTHPSPANSTILYVTIDRTVTEEPSVMVSSTVTVATTDENNTSGGGGNKAAREGDSGDEVVIVAAVLSTLAVLTAVLAVVCIVYQRRRKRNQPSTLAVEFAPGKTTENIPSDRTHMYDSLNLLYESGEQDKASASEPIYETADVNTKVAENLLYERVVKGRTQITNADQTPSECNDYQEPMCAAPKSNGTYKEPIRVPETPLPKGITVSNPGYGRTIELNQTIDGCPNDKRRHIERFHLTSERPCWG